MMAFTTFLALACASFVASDATGCISYRTDGRSAAWLACLPELESSFHIAEERHSLGESLSSRTTQGSNRRRRNYSASSFSCPHHSTTDKNQWIQEFTVSTVSRDVVTNRFSGRNAAHSTQNVDIVHFAVKGATLAQVQSQTKDDSGQVPSTAAAMGLHNDVVKKYNEGFYEHNYNKNIDNHLKFGQGSLTRDSWWKLDTDCYAMASYSEVKQDATKEIKPENTYAKAVNLRVAKFAVCYKSDCAEKKLVMDCWIESNTGTWEQCHHWQDEGFVSAILARG